MRNITIDEIVSDILDGVINSVVVSSIIKLDKVYCNYDLDSHDYALSGEDSLIIKNMGEYILQNVETESFETIQLLIKDGETIAKRNRASNVVPDIMSDYIIYHLSEMIRKNKLKGDVEVKQTNELTKEMELLFTLLLDFIYDEENVVYHYIVVDGEIVACTASVYYGDNTYHINRFVSIGNGYGKLLLKHINKDYDIELFPLSEVEYYYERLGFVDDDDRIRVPKHGII